MLFLSAWYYFKIIYDLFFCFCVLLSEEVFEFVTFPIETYKGSYRPDYGGKSIWWDLNHGYSELAPELGFQSKFDTGRSLNW